MASAPRLRKQAFVAVAAGAACLLVVLFSSFNTPPTSAAGGMPAGTTLRHDATANGVGAVAPVEFVPAIGWSRRTDAGLCDPRAAQGALPRSLSMPALRQLLSCHTPVVLPDHVDFTIQQWRKRHEEIAAAGQGPAIVYWCGPDDNVKPVPLSHALVPNAIDWQLPASMLDQVVITSVNAVRDNAVAQSQELVHRLLTGHCPEVWALNTNVHRSAMAARMLANAIREGRVSPTCQHSKTTTDYSRLECITPELARRYRAVSLVGWKWQPPLDLLFRPSPALVTAIGKLLQTTTHVWSSKPSVCVHMRTGAADAVMRGDTSFKVDNAWANDDYINATLHAAAGLVDSLSKHIAVAKPLREAQDKMAGRGSSLRGGYTARQASGHEEVTLYVAADAPNQATRLNRLAREQSLSTGSRTTHKLVFQQIDADTAHVESEHTSVDDFVMTHAQLVLLTLCDGLVFGSSGFARAAVNWAGMPGHSAVLKAYYTGLPMLNAERERIVGNNYGGTRAAAIAHARAAVPLGVFSAPDATLVAIEQLRFRWQTDAIVM